MGKVGEERLEKPKASTANVGIFIEKASRYTAIDRLTPELLRLSPAIVLKKYLENRIPIAWIQHPALQARQDRLRSRIGAGQNPRRQRYGL